MELGNPNTGPEDPVVVLGAGPAGLTAAYELVRRGRRAVVLEADDTVGGLARTVVRDGYRFDLGGHRFYTKSDEVSALWHELLGDELLLRPRMSRIRWRGTFLDYPLRGGEVVRKVGPVELTRCASSFAAASVRRRRNDDTFEGWVTSRFGARLYELFFRTYTEKVWGVPASELRGEWAAQRIRGLSLLAAAKAAMPGRGGSGIRSLVEEFHYPRLGPGQMWEEMARRICAAGGEVRLGARVNRIETQADRITAVGTADGDVLRPTEVISSLPLRTMAAVADPVAPRAVLDAAGGLRYRDFLTVALIIEGEEPFPDNWIYIHDPAVRVGRIQNYRAWSPWMVPEPQSFCVGLEYFCFEGDELWQMADDDLVDLAGKQLERLGLGNSSRVTAGHVVRVPKAYPVYDAQYAERVAALRSWLEGFGNLQQVGRNGLHRYNNSDHSMLTAIRAVQNLEGADHDIWAVNTESAYHEEDAPEQPYRSAPRTPAMGRALAEEARASSAA